MGGVDPLDKKTGAYKLDSKSCGGLYYLRLFFDLTDISVVNSHNICKLLYPKAMELPDFKTVLAKSLIGSNNSHSQNTPVSHMSRRVLQTTRGKCRYCYTGGIEN